MPIKADLHGRVFGRLRVIEEAPTKATKTNWLCHCACGNRTIVRSAHLLNGNTTSCGCVKRETWIAARTKHGRANTVEHQTWKRMLARCRGKGLRRDRRNYLERGITVCERWRTSFANFYEDMGPRPSPKHSIDRRDNNGHYTPENCRWVLPVVQMNNQSKTKHLTLNGETHTIREWAVITGLPYPKLASRVYNGWSDHRALTQPLGKRVNAPGLYKKPAHPPTRTPNS